MKQDRVLASADFQSILAKVVRANEHARLFRLAIDRFWNDADNYELIFDIDHPAREIDVYGRLQAWPPMAELGAQFGDIISCDRAALDHLVWALSVRHSGAPPPFPIPWDSAWKEVGFPIVADSSQWNGALKTKLAMVEPNLHSRFRDLQPFVTNPTAPKEGWLWMLHHLWNIDKHQVIHIGKLTIALEQLTATRRSDGQAIRFDMMPTGPQPVTLDNFDAETHLARLAILDSWPVRADEVQVDRGLRVQLALDSGPPGFGKGMDFAQGQMHNAVVLAAHAFEAEFV